MVVYSFCQCCRNPIDENNLLSVDSSTSDVFCSETCIAEFYDQEIAMFASLEDQFRNELALNQEQIDIDQESKTKVFNLALSEPDIDIEFSSTNGKKYYFRSKKINESGSDIHQGVVFSQYDGKPSFVFNHFLTSSPSLISKYTLDKNTKTDNISSFKEIEIPMDVIEQAQLKKSEYLAELLSVHDDEDFPFEEFEKYASSAVKTIEDADEIFESTDDDGDLIHTYVKSFSIDGKDFFYISINMIVRDETIQKGSDILVPILGFPSNDKSIYQQYAHGKRVKEFLKS